MKRRIGVALAVALLCVLGRAICAADTQDPNAIVDKAIKALGGEEKLGKIKAASWKIKGKISVMGNELENTTTMTFQGLDHFRQVLEGEFNGNKFKAVTVLAEDKGSRMFGDMHQDLNKEDLINVKRTTYLTIIPITILPLKSKDFKLESIDEEKVNDKPAVGIKVTASDKKDFKIYFDKESGLPVRLVAKVVGFMGMGYVQTTTFSDYKEMEGIKKATKAVSLRDGEKFIDQEITEFKILDKVDPKLFTEL